MKMSFFYKKIASWQLKAVWVASLAFAVAACEPKLEAPSPSAGTADFSKYVAIGNSLTAGFSDGALYLEGQQTSYAYLLAQQMKLAGGGEFTVPFVPAGNGIGGGGGGKLVLGKIGGSLVPIPTPGDTTALRYIGDKGPYNNMAVPGAKAIHLPVNGYGSALGNPFFRRFASKATASIIEDAAAQKPTFFTLWIGNNDVLGYASNGGASDDVTPIALFDRAIDASIAGLKASNPNLKGAIATIPNILKAPYFTTIPYNAVDISAAQAEALNAGLRGAVASGAKPKVEAGVKAAVEVGVRAKVTEAVKAQVTTEVTAAVRADVKAKAIAAGQSEADAEATADAFVKSKDGQKTIENLVNDQMKSAEFKALIDSNTAAQMTSPEVKALVDAKVKEELDKLLVGLPTFVAGKNPFLIEDKKNPLGFRQAKAGELILLPALLTIRDPKFVPATPLPNNLVLSEDEVIKVVNGITAYNNKLKKVADENNYAFVDIAAFLDNVATGYSFNGVTYSTTFVTGGAFSLDGLHLTDRGAALITNEFVKAINAKYKSSLNAVDANQYLGIKFPQ